MDDNMKRRMIWVWEDAVEARMAEADIYRVLDSDRGRFFGYQEIFAAIFSKGELSDQRVGFRARHGEMVDKPYGRLAFSQ